VKGGRLSPSPVAAHVCDGGGLGWRSFAQTLINQYHCRTSRPNTHHWRPAHALCQTRHPL
jgi:hypothetical protein